MSFLANKSAAIRWISIALIVASIVALTRILPFDRAVALLQGYVADLGIVGPLAFGAAYIIATVLFIPGSVLTFAAGAIFGLAVGTATVIVSATLGGALAFLIARYALRGRVEALALRNSKFFAIDTAIEQGGWKIVGLLRLSPAVPFVAANYLLGLTKIRFGSYVVTSFVTMLPGTFMYVYLGYAGRASAGGGRTSGEWALLVVGLLATIAVTVYVTKLAKRALAEHTKIDTPARDEAAVEKPSGRVPFGFVAAAAAAVAIAAFGYVNKDAISAAFGPPQVNLEEKFERKPDGPRFDHSVFDAIVAAHVDADGWVDYEAIDAKRARLDAYLDTIAIADLEPLGRDERLAFYINAYNAYTLALILDHDRPESIKDIPRADRWDAVRWSIGGTNYSLNQIEHELIRGQFKEPRIHFAVNCASVGCPPLRNEAFTGAKLEAQLAAQTDYVHRHERWFRFDPDAGELALTRLYQWYANDFEQVSGSAIKYAATHSPELAKALASGKSIKRRLLDYDWTLNSTANRPGPQREPIAEGTSDPGRSPDPGRSDDVPPSDDVETSPTPVTSADAVPEPAGANVVKSKPKANKKTAKPAKPKQAAKPKTAATPKPQPEPEPEPEPKPTSTGGSSGGGSSSGGGGSSGAPIPRGYR